MRLRSTLMRNAAHLKRPAADNRPVYDCCLSSPVATSRRAVFLSPSLLRSLWQSSQILCRARTTPFHFLKVSRRGRLALCE
jgi:hypothetical protein